MSPGITDQLQKKDEEIQQCCEEKNRLMDELIAVYNDTEEQKIVSYYSSNRMA